MGAIIFTRDVIVATLEHQGYVYDHYIPEFDAILLIKSTGCVLSTVIVDPEGICYGLPLEELLCIT